MIKLMREGARKYPWILKSLMGILAIVFVITMGWWGFSEQQSDAVASVGDTTVTRDEFRRAYENTYRFYKEKVQGDFKEETLKQFVVEGLIESKIWSIVAKDLGVRVSPEELRESIVRREEFQRNGQFDPEIYRRVLAANHLTPAMFENLHALELQQDKAQTVIRDSVALTPDEIAEAQALQSRQPQPETPVGLSAKDRILQDLLLQKQQRALLAYKESVRARLPIEIHKEML
jgi:hypothetical protein